MTRWICALVGAALFPCPALAGVLLPTEPGSRPLKVRKQHIDVEVKDQVARAPVDEVFENLADKPLAALYLLPLPEGAAVSGFASWVDGRRVESVIREKDQAKKEYEAAQAARAQPAMLEKEDAGVFKTRVDGIPAHGTRRLEAAFAQILPYDGGLVTLRIPLAVKGREGSEPIGEFRFRLDVKDQKKITELKVLSHPAKVERVDANNFRVSLDGRDVRAEGELVATYRTESSRLGLSFVPFKPEGEKEGYFLLLASPQELTTAADIVHKDVVFVFDTSGSMSSEDKIGQARQALKRCLSNLNREDNFGIVAFSDSMNPFRNKLVPASAANVTEAMAFADGLYASGGTNISGALLSGLAMVQESERPRVLVFMTDGIPSAGIGAPETITEVVKQKNTGGGRIFSFGVGSDVNRTLLERLARENRGSHDFVERGQSIDQVVGTFYAKISRPVLSDLSFDFGDVTTAMQYPDVLPDLYKGSQLVLVGRYRGNGKVQAALTGTLNGQKHRIPFEAEFPESESTNAFVARLWAQKRIDFLMSQNRLHGEREEARKEIIALSTRHQILTAYTSMVAVRNDSARVAAVSPSRVKPGDPVVYVRAPKDAERVTVTLPWGKPKRARWDDEAQAWSVRFLVPPGTADGAYPISVEIRGADGEQQQLALEIAIDTAAPAIAARIPSVRAGQPLALRAWAVISPGEVLRAFTSREDGYGAFKSLFDIRRVTARLWDGREVPLELEPGGLGFRALADTNAALAPGSYEVVFTAQDFAGNDARTVARVEVK